MPEEDISEIIGVQKWVLAEKEKGDKVSLFLVGSVAFVSLLLESEVSV